MISQLFLLNLLVADEFLFSHKLFEVELGPRMDFENITRTTLPGKHVKCTLNFAMVTTKINA